MKLSTNLTSGLQTSDVFNAVRTSYELSAVPRLIADWNLNRYTTPTAGNLPPEVDSGFDLEAFPIESIIDPIRPTKGILKALVGQATAGSTYQLPDDPKYYVGSINDVYKYWVSPFPTGASGIFPLHTDGFTSCRPHVLYPTVQQANKIVIKIDNTWATPNAWTVISRPTTGAVGTGVWSTIATNPALANDGTLTLYYNGSAWVTTRPATLVTTSIGGLGLAVTTLKGGKNRRGENTTYMKRTLSGGVPTGLPIEYTTDGFNANFSLIAIEAHLEADLTSRLISVDDNFDMSDTSQLYPIGTLTTNEATITLSNDDGIFNTENATSPYYGLLEPNVEFNLEYIYTIGGVQHSVQQFKLYGDIWSGQFTDTVQINLEDFSKYLKETKPRAAMYQGKAVTELIWRVLDSIGFVDYDVTEEDRVVEHTIPFFWTDGVKTAWEVLDELAKATQTAIYFNAAGRLQVRTREAAFRDLASPDWTLYGQTESTNLTDILDDGLNVTESFEANSIDVKYRATKWKVATDGRPALSKVWEPDTDTVVVRSAPLIRNITSGSTNIWLDQKVVRYWPYKGKVNIDAEIIQYEGKEFVYYTYTKNVSGGGVVTYTNETKNTIFVYDADEYKKYDLETPTDKRVKNYFTGALKIKTRAIWNSENKDHSVDAAGWTPEMEIDGKTTATFITPSRGFKHNKKLSTVTLATPPRMVDANDTLWVRRGATGDPASKMIGTRFRFNADKASTTQRGGFGFYVNGSRNKGYYIEFCLSNSLTASDRKTRSEVMIYSRTGGTWELIAKGAPVAIAKKVWYEADVYITPGTQDTIAVWFNGQKVAEGTTVTATKQPSGGRFAMYARGKTNMDFEYIYGIIRTVPEPADSFGFFDLKYGGVRGDMWIREHVWRTQTRWQPVARVVATNEAAKYNQYFFDEFGPYVHEVREFDVKFDPKPVQYSTLFSTNQWNSVIVEYVSNPFGAKFVIANASRTNAILHGEDSITYAGAGQNINQVLTVLGRNLEISDDETVNKKNLQAIRSRGKIEVELASEWIQSKEMAETIATWMAQHWSAGVDEVAVQIYGNPLIEIGDVVAIDFDAMHMTTTTHKYFVVGTKTSFDAGIETTLKLRRIRTTAESALS